MQCEIDFICHVCAANAGLKILVHSWLIDFNLCVILTLNILAGFGFIYGLII